MKQIEDPIINEDIKAICYKDFIHDNHLIIEKGKIMDFIVYKNGIYITHIIDFPNRSGAVSLAFFEESDNEDMKLFSDYFQTLIEHREERLKQILR